MPESTGLMESLKRLVSTLLTIVQTRLGLLSNELEEERLRIRQIILLGIIAAFFLGLSIILLAALLVVVFWENYRIPVLGCLAVSFLIAGLFALKELYRVEKERSRLFSDSLSELSKDIERLTPGHE